MEVLGSETVDGINFPTSYKTYWFTADEKPGAYIIKIEVLDIRFEQRLAKDFFEVPNGARILE